jgi:hypothetical protein
MLNEDSPQRTRETRGNAEKLVSRQFAFGSSHPQNKLQTETANFIHLCETLRHPVFAVKFSRLLANFTDEIKTNAGRKSDTC